MNIPIGKYRLCSDKFSMWIMEEYEAKDANGRTKTATRRVAGYSQTFEQLYKSFVQHRYRASEAETVKDLLKAFAQTEKDLKEIKSAALKGDFKIIRKIAKEKGIK